jgi:hypothetical protein
VTKKELTIRKDQLIALRAEQASLKKAVERFYELSRQIDRLHLEVTRVEEHQKLEKIRDRCDFVEPDFPSVGTPGMAGSAELCTEKEGEQLTKLLSNSYYFVYELHWTKPGRYLVLPTYSYDHDREMVYTAHVIHEDDPKQKQYKL